MKQLCPSLVAGLGGGPQLLHPVEGLRAAHLVARQLGDGVAVVHLAQRGGRGGNRRVYLPCRVGAELGNT